MSAGKPWWVRGNHRGEGVCGNHMVGGKDKPWGGEGEHWGVHISYWGGWSWEGGVVR